MASIAQLRADSVMLILFLSLQLFSNTHESTAAPKLIVISFDGFRPDYVNATVTPHLFKLAQSGVTARHMKSSFGTKTLPNHMSIATGLFQESHGIIHNKVCSLALCIV